MDSGTRAMASLGRLRLWEPSLPNAWLNCVFIFDRIKIEQNRRGAQLRRDVRRNVDVELQKQQNWIYSKLKTYNT